MSACIKDLLLSTSDGEDQENMDLITDDENVEQEVFDSHVEQSTSEKVLTLELPARRRSQPAHQSRISTSPRHDSATKRGVTISTKTGVTITFPNKLSNGMSGRAGTRGVDFPTSVPRHNSHVTSTLAEAAVATPTESSAIGQRLLQNFNDRCKVGSTAIIVGKRKPTEAPVHLSQESTHDETRGTKDDERLPYDQFDVIFSRPGKLGLTCEMTKDVSNRFSHWCLCRLTGKHVRLLC